MSRILVGAGLAMLALGSAAGAGGVKPLAPPERLRELEPAPGAVGARRPVPAPAAAGAIALIGGTLHTVSGEVISGGTVVMAEGKILALGRGIEIPADARRIDISGKHLWPAMIHASTVLGLTEVGAVRATNDINEVGDINPNARPEVAADPDSELIPVTRSNGVLLAITGGRGGLISGSAALLELDGWTAAEMTLKAPAALLLNWPGMRLDRSPDAVARTPLDKQARVRDEQVEKIRDAFATARAYLRGHHIKPSDSDVKWEAMSAALRREVPVVVRAGTVLEIEAALRFAEEQSLRLVIEGGTDAWRVAKKLKQRGVAVIAANVFDLSRDWEPYDVNFSTPRKLHEAGVEFCIAQRGDSWNSRNLPYIAAKAVAFGLPADEAMKAITLYPARIFGVADRLGSLEAGKDATLFLSTGDPLDIRSNVERAWIRGREIDLGDRHKSLYERWRLKPRRAAAR